MSLFAGLSRSNTGLAGPLSSATLYVSRSNCTASNQGQVELCNILKLCTR